jgi:transcriptional regulator GlxA family with amidase domain
MPKWFMLHRAHAVGHDMSEAKTQIGFLLFPRLTQLDMTGPFEVFARLPNSAVHLTWKTLDPITSDGGMRLVPTITFGSCPALDLLCVRGGPGVNVLLEDGEVLEFLRQEGSRAAASPPRVRQPRAPAEPVRPAGVRSASRAR